MKLSRIDKKALKQHKKAVRKLEKSEKKKLIAIEKRQDVENRKGYRRDTFS